jgi:hypothetical protein
MVPGWVPFKMLSDSPALQSRWLLLLKMDMSKKNNKLSIAALVYVKVSSNLNCSYMAKSSLTYIPEFFVKFFFQPIYTVYANYTKNIHIFNFPLLLYFKSNLNCGYMVMSSLTYIPGLSVKFFFQPIYTVYANFYILIKDHI